MEELYNNWQLIDKDLGNGERYQFTKSELLDFANYYHYEIKKDKNFTGYTTIDIKGGQIIIHKGEIYTPEFIKEYNKMN